MSCLLNFTSICDVVACTILWFPRLSYARNDRLWQVFKIVSILSLWEKDKIQSWSHLISSLDLLWSSVSHWIQIHKELTGNAESQNVNTLMSDINWFDTWQIGHHKAVRKPTFRPLALDKGFSLPNWLRTTTFIDSNPFLKMSNFFWITIYLTTFRQFEKWKTLHYFKPQVSLIHDHLTLHEKTDLPSFATEVNM